MPTPLRAPPPPRSCGVPPSPLPLHVPCIFPCISPCMYPCICPASPLHLPCISLASALYLSLYLPLHLPCICPASALHLPCICPEFALNLPCISPAFPVMALPLHCACTRPTPILRCASHPMHQVRRPGLIMGVLGLLWVQLLSGTTTWSTQAGCRCPNGSRWRRRIRTRFHPSASPLTLPHVPPPPTFPRPPRTHTAPTPRPPTSRLGRCTGAPGAAAAARPRGFCTAAVLGRRARTEV